MANVGSVATFPRLCLLETVVGAGLMALTAQYTNILYENRIG